MEDQKKKVIDPESTDYSFSDIEEDERFIQCRKEAIVSIIMYFVMAGAMLLAMYTVGAGEPAQYTYIFGMPSWYFAVGCAAVAAIVVLYILLAKFYRHMSLDPVGGLEAQGAKDTMDAQETEQGE